MNSRILCDASLRGRRSLAGPWYWRLSIHALGMAMLVSGGCALQPAYVTPPLATPTAWSAQRE
ncbi:hypothetical protein, partial [Pseudomonas viridiflava]